MNMRRAANSIRPNKPNAIIAMVSLAVVILQCGCSSLSEFKRHQWPDGNGPMIDTNGVPIEVTE